MTKVTCPVCYSSDIKTELVFKTDSKNYNYFRCNNCSLVFIGKTVFAEYGKDYYKHFRGSLLRKIEKSYVYLSNLFKKYLIESNLNKKAKMKILDIGSGNGDFLNVLDNSYIKEGVELKRLKENSGINGVKMHYTSVDNLNLTKDSYNLVTMWHVLEHLSNPIKSLKIVYNSLAKDGRFILSTPDTNSLGYRMAGGKWYHFDFPYHNYLYNKQVLSLLADKTGFKIINFINYPLEFPLDLFWSLLKSKKVILLILIYPFVKLIDQETLICVLEKK